MKIEIDVSDETTEIIRQHYGLDEIDEQWVKTFIEAQLFVALHKIKKNKRATEAAP